MQPWTSFAKKINKNAAKHLMLQSNYLNLADPYNLPQQKDKQKMTKRHRARKLE